MSLETLGSHAQPPVRDQLPRGFLGKPGWMWLGFLALVALLIAFDLGVLHRVRYEWVLFVFAAFPGADRAQNALEQPTMCQT